VPTIHISTASIHHSIDPTQGQQLIFPCTIYANDIQVSTHYLADSGASAKGFISKEFVKKHKLPTAPLQQKTLLRLADGRPVGALTHMAQIRTAIRDHISESWLYVTNVDPKQDIIFGMPWLELHDPTTSWSERSLIFDSDHCLSYCCHLPVTVFSGKTPPSTKNTRLKDANFHDIHKISAEAFYKMARKKDHEVVVMSLEDFKQLNQDPGTDRPILAGSTTKH
jgi:hypothetical protein